ncbi:MAG TPA: TIGR00730 family Rossman fold protein [Zoogloea sp.]|uniref:LOG family protein n=2 Tax=Zoogloea sp. TaxID=49181 RepID=UPI002BDCF7C3|nr:TIGR00730 family Rossman fold protein [Zoogloea sp.]HND23494.1 TIGR00730 family Rossman fold protein [Rhodocyclaceae bacterium]HNI46494.1 TIGR00730 family Rossman fold protein [Zoogloea sp.]HNI81907.1 TIGR00730 family Rossman fold protein [Rhodocyclaceae bacterium]
MKRICVFCGSRPGSRPEYRAAAEFLGTTLAERGIELVYGGGNVGLMGVVADACLAAGGRVVGVIPRALLDWEVGHEGLTRLEVVDSMHTRKARMAELADGFIALPGGLGTFEELFEILTWAQLGFHAKPVGLLDTAGYYLPLLQMIERGVAEGFMKAENRGLLLAEDNLFALLRAMGQYHPPTVSKRIREEKHL